MTPDHVTDYAARDAARESYCLWLANAERKLLDRRHRPPTEAKTKSAIRRNILAEL